MATYTMLGSGTLLPDDARHSSAHLVEVGGVRLLMDCGPGTLHGFARNGVDWPAITHLAITHYHTDHVGDLSAILFALKWGLQGSRTEPLTLVGPRGFQGFLQALSGALGEHILDPGFEIRIVEVGPGDVLEVSDEAGLRLTSHPTHHTDESVAYRLDWPGGSFGYTGDTGPMDGLGGFFSGCDVLVAECAQIDPPPLDIHLSPRGVAALAGEAMPGTLVLTHVYPPLTPDEAERQVRAAGYGGALVAAEDGRSFPLPHGGV